MKRPDIEFAVVGLLVRAQLAEGQVQNALETLKNSRRRFEDMGETRFFPNIDALLCRIHMRQGETALVNRWLNEKAPKDDLDIWALHRYQHFTKAMALIANGEQNQVLVILARLSPYMKKCNRSLDQITIHLLAAVCYFNMNNDCWQTELSKALDLSFECSYIRPVAEYGVAILPLLTTSTWNTNTVFKERLIAVTRVQAVNYPLFLKREAKLLEPLTASEQQVLKLLCHNMSNQEICNILGIKLASTKTHVSRILQKMGVNRRSEAKEVAETLGLI